MQIDTQTLKCPNCGAPLNAGAGVAEVTCTYCGSDVRVQLDEQGMQIALLRQTIAERSAAATSVRKVRTGALLIVAIIVAGIVGISLGVALLSQSIFRSSPSFDMALKLAQTNPQVVAAFGKPLTPGLFVFGNISSNGNQSSASYRFPITGPLRSGELQVQGSENADGWRLDVWAVYQQDGKNVSIHMTRAP